MPGCLKPILVRVPLFFIFLSGCGNQNNKEIAASGTIEATEVTVSAKVGGQIIELRADEGTNVRTGDTLALIDPTDYILQLRQAEANAAALEAQYKLAVRGARQEDLIQAEANYKNAETDLKRMEELFTSKSIAQKQLDDAQTRFVNAEQAWEKMKRGSRSEEIDVARARRDQAAAQADAARKKVKDCTIIAPMSGVVTLRAVEAGEIVPLNGAVLRISRLDNVHLMIYVSEQELGRVKIGQEVNVHIDTYRDKSFPGKVVYISPAAEFTPKNVQTKDDRTKLVFGVKIEVENPDGSLKPGMPADATVHTQ